MQHLLQPRVLNAASLAGAASALACYPRLALWLGSPGPVWFLEATIFLSGIVLWGFVLAWHVPYTGRPVFNFKIDPGPFITATVVAAGTAMVFYWWLDPALRAKLPREYPADAKEWGANVLFSLALAQLFLVFAACDWMMRLSKRRWLAMGFTAILAAAVQAMRIHSLPGTFSTGLTVLLVGLRAGGGLLAAAFYLRGGALLVWWWALILESRNLIAPP